MITRWMQPVTLLYRLKNYTQVDFTQVFIRYELDKKEDLLRIRNLNQK